MPPSWENNASPAAWETKDMAAALKEAVGTVDGIAANGDATDGTVIAEETRNPQALGWTAKSAYDYEAYNKSSKELHDDEQARGIDGSTWASDAVRYEWEDDFGDIGPRNEELEKHLFGSDFHVRHGIEFHK